MLENAVCPFKMYRHGATQVFTKKRDLAIIIWRDRQYFCLIINQKAGWLVGMYCASVSFSLPSRALEMASACAELNFPWVFVLLVNYTGVSPLQREMEKNVAVLVMCALPLLHAGE